MLLFKKKWILLLVLASAAAVAGLQACGGQGTGGKVAIKFYGSGG